ncbi:OmpA family protein [Novilysobacter spongiicola]|uniref:OmpA family protein n=1 Tax=Lysobacter spongiicola DSM 21749 TaxID=1122188 RepID=A0A1T4Q005_9GAMM|nr:OmpA family protein [Lysobacter spongiicola]SJZ96841.1 OmpA family protein [Lysobacter spongiicola DSM 21749]
MIRRLSLLRPLVLGIAFASMLSACSGDDSSTAAATAGAEAPESDVAPEGTANVAAAATDDDSRNDVDPDESGFTIESVPISEVSLGEFPYFSIPEGHREDPLNTVRLDFAQVAFWTGDRYETIEGRVYATGIRRERDSGKQFSSLQVARDLEQAIKSAGGVEIFQGEEPKQEREAKAIQSLMRQYDLESKCWAHDPAQVFVIRREDREIWIRVCQSRRVAGFIVGETQALVPTVTLLPAGELKQQLDADGKVALQVNFATDRAEILPESQPQIEQVLALLQAHPDLKLSINGHTDDSGDAAHNQQLSEARAASVAAALTAEGIDPSRLQTQGFGQSEPVADNATEAGKAKNRRVELVRI